MTTRKYYDGQATGYGKSSPTTSKSIEEINLEQEAIKESEHIKTDDFRMFHERGYIAGRSQNLAREKEYREALEREWISVETKPRDGQSILIAYKFGVAEGRFYCGKFVTREFENEYPNVTHWMPLPAPPNKEPDVQGCDTMEVK